MSLWGHADAQRLEQSLRALLDSGKSLEEAVRTVHRDEGMGALLICPAVEAVAGLPPQDAKQLVVQVLSPMWRG